MLSNLWRSLPWLAGRPPSNREVLHLLALVALWWGLAVAGMAGARGQELGGARCNWVTAQNTATGLPVIGDAARTGGTILTIPTHCAVAEPAGGGTPPRTAKPRTDLLAAERARLRRAKCRIIVTELYPDSGFLCYVDFFCAEHERLGMPEAWWDSLVYGAANFSLRVGGIAPGGCAGPMDVKRRPLVLDPEENIRWHCREMAGFYRRGVRGLDLCEHVFLPRAPRDWGGGRFAKTDARHRACIARAYRDGRLP